MLSKFRQRNAWNIARRPEQNHAQRTVISPAFNLQHQLVVRLGAPDDIVLVFPSESQRKFLKFVRAEVAQRGNEQPIEHVQYARFPGAVDSNEQGDPLIQGNLFGEIPVEAFYDKMLEKHGGTFSHSPVPLASLILSRRLPRDS